MEKNSKLIVGVLIAAAIVVGGFALMQNNKDETVETTKETPAATVQEAPKNIVGLAVATPDLSTLVTAVKAADLVETLSGEGPFTVFAPTNAAFAALPSGTLDSLLLPENKTKLASVLTYHVVSGKVMAKDLSDGQKVTTVQGQELMVSIKDGKVMVGGAEVTTADVSASNGVVHVINSVLLPQ